MYYSYYCKWKFFYILQYKCEKDHKFNKASMMQLKWTPTENMHDYLRQRKENKKHGMILTAS